MLDITPTSQNIRSVKLGISQRFWARVEKTDACWLWTGAKLGKFGYGGVSGTRKPGSKWPVPRYAHRVAYELTHGSIPEGQSVLHSCDVPACVNPEHLFLGNHADNMRDASVKGRLNIARKRTRQSQPQAVARFLAGASAPTVAREFGICQRTVLRWVHAAGHGDLRYRSGPRRVA